MKNIPSDEELIEFATQEQFILFCDKDEFVDIARSVLMKWCRNLNHETIPKQDPEGRQAAKAIAIYCAVTGKTESDYCQLSTEESILWERAAKAAESVQ